MPRIRLLPLLAAMLLVLAGAANAHAGQYTLTYDFTGDLSGWSGYVEPGYLLCGRGATAGCPDVSTNRILAQPGAAQAVWSQGRWEWTAPPGTLIVGGSLAYRTRMRHSQFYARVKMRADGVTWDAAPTLVNEQQTTALTDHVIPLAAGFRQVGVALYAHPAAGGVVTDVWDDYVTLVRMVVTVQDATPPALIWVDGGGLLDGAWHRGDVCATFGLGDHESGAGAVWLASGAASAVWNAAPSGSQYQPAAAYAQPTLCLGAAALGDGIHAGAVGGLDASGGQSAPLAFTVRVDTAAPVARLLAPGAVASDARPGIELEVGDATSGVASVVARIDGEAVPLDLSGARATGRPAAPLAYGAHTLVWSVADAAGNRTEGSTRFDVPDLTPPSLGTPQPPSGAAGGAPAGPVIAGGAIAVPGAPATAARRRTSLVRAVQARIGSARPRTVIVTLRARARLRVVLQVRCGLVTRQVRVRASPRGIAKLRVACAGPATVHMVVRPGRLLVRIAGRRLPLRLQVQPQRRAAPTVARVVGRLAEMRGHVVVLEALTATGWRRVGQARADSAGRFATSFAIVRAGQFAVRARVAALAAIPSAPFVLTMR